MSRSSLHATYKKLFEQVAETLEENKRLKARIVELEEQVASQQSVQSDGACTCGIEKLREWTVDGNGNCVECHQPRR